MSRGLRIPYLRDPHECEHVRSRLTDYLDDDLEPADQRRLERHVRFCPRCRRVLRNLRTTIDRLAHLDSPTPSAPDEDAAARVVDGWRRRTE